MLIASRTLTFRDGDAETKISIRIFAPVPAPNGSWSCRYEIDWPDKTHALDVGGYDSTQALVLTLQIIGAEIYSSNYHKSGQLLWDKTGNGYGFPVVPTLRDLLQGDDAKYL